MPRISRPIAERLAAASVRDESTGCLVWRWGRSAAGYGKVLHQGRRRLAHRVSYEETNGPVPAGLELDHLCRNRACIEPSHLEPVTHLENVRRGWRANTTHCKHGHPLSGDNLRINKKPHFRICRQCVRDVQKRRRERATK